MYLYKVGFVHPIFGFERHQHEPWTLDLSETRDPVGVRPRSGLLTECIGIFTTFSPSCYAVLMSFKKSETAVYGCNPALFKFHQCRVDALQSSS